MAWHPERGEALALSSIGAQGSAADCQRRVYVGKDLLGTTTNVHKS
jgi:hypothetical protein